MTSSILPFLFLFSVCYALRSDCPEEEKIAPLCICKDLGDGPMMLCTKVMSPEDLVSPIMETENHDMFSLAIHESSLLYIPDKIFLRTNFQKIRLVGTELMSLSETDIAFEGLEDTLEEFRVMDAPYVTEWTWDGLRNLQKLNLVDVDWVSLGSISEPFPALKALTALAITKADISFIVDGAFKELESLKILILKNNAISELTRSIFPDQADALVILDFSGNKLDDLPQDIFERMPSLSDVNLDNNNFVTLNEGAFSSALKKVSTLSLRGNNLRCDCRMQWLVDERKPDEFYAECSQPESLKGVNVRSLVRKDLWC